MSPTLLPRLRREVLPSLPATSRPAIDGRDVGVGIVHLGEGAFHRAHQAVFTEAAIATRHGDWAIIGVTQRSRRVVEQLAPQDDLYSLIERGPGPVSIRVVDVLADVFSGSEEPERLSHLMASPTIRVVTLTVTEAGYRMNPATGQLREDDEDVVADATTARSAHTVVGQLAHGLAARYRGDRTPLSILSCDNLAHNGAVLRGLVLAFFDLSTAPDAGQVQAWVADQVAFPSCVVDRIVPPTTDSDRQQVADVLRVRDEATVVAEPYRSWVIEDRFPGGRPRWEVAGAILTDDATPYELAKLRILNGSHSLLAFAGGLAGYVTVAEAIADGPLRGVTEAYMAEAGTTIADRERVDVPAFVHAILQRFENRALPHLLTTIATDGSLKLPGRIVDTALSVLDAGGEPRWSAFVVAAWLHWLRVTVAAGVNPREPRLPRLAHWLDRAPEAVVSGVLQVEEVFGPQVAGSRVLQTLVTDWLDQLRRFGIPGALVAS